MGELLRDQCSRGGHAIAENQKNFAINLDGCYYITPPRHGPLQEGSGACAVAARSGQVAHPPKAKREKAGLEECHRASVLLFNDDTILIETEYLKEAQPRRRGSSS